MKIKHILLVALMALALSLASIGVTGAAIAGGKPSVAPGSNVIGVVAAPETVIAGRKPGIAG